jgi:hypothetical protein
VAGLELADVRLGQDVDVLEPFHGGDAVPVGHDEPEGRAVVSVERLAVHLIGDQDLGFRIGGVGEGQGPLEGQVGGVDVLKDRVEQVGAVVGAGEADLDARGGRLGLLEHLVQEGAGPASGGDGVVTPWFADRQRSHRQAPVPGAFQRDDPLDRGHGTQVVQRQGPRLVDRATDLEGSVVGGDREVAADIVELGRGDVALEGLRRGFGVEGLAVDHRQRRT